MIPHADGALRMLSQRLMTQLLPDLKSLYSLSDGALIGLLINAIADETAEGIQRRLDDIGEMKIIFAAGEALLSSRDKQDINTELSSYRLADVNDHHDALTRILVSLHQKTEDNDNETLNRAIWAYLRRHSQRHKITAVP
ncbi:MAG: hypothetical protein HON77_12160 [Gammaproteobacteria bacterium]|jgi:hypothetical protein|nr:hypothetical protein [Gammaproteobacteria bacterium]